MKMGGRDAVSFRDTQEEAWMMGLHLAMLRHAPEIETVTKDFKVDNMCIYANIAQSTKRKQEGERVQPIVGDGHMYTARHHRKHSNSNESPLESLRGSWIRRASPHGKDHLGMA